MSNPAPIDFAPTIRRIVGQIALVCCLCAAGWPQASMASGGGGLVGGGNQGSPRPAREVDQLYEHGKAIYLGRTPGAQKVDYCLKVDGEPRKLRRKHLRAWRGGDQLEFANALYNCKMPDELALASVRKEEIAFVLYYLNKRFKLDLASR